MNMKDFNNRRNYANYLLLERKLLEMETAIDDLLKSLNFVYSAN